MPDVVVWQENDEATCLARVVRALSEGRIALLPTESTYEATVSALQPEAIAQLASFAGDEPLALTIAQAQEAYDWLPALAAPAERLLRKIGAGPWKLRSDGGARFGLLARLPEPVQGVLCPDDRHLALRWPEHAAWSWTTRLLRAPLVSVAFDPAVTTAENAAVRLGEVGSIVLDAGPSLIGQPVAILRVTGREWVVERAGSISEADFADILAYRLLFICSGNTCRSPMAEALCRRLLADRLGCAQEELAQRGFRVQSAGLSAMMGSAASAEAVAVANELGAELGEHRSQPLTLELLALADRVFTMTANHLRVLEGAAGAGLPALEMLAPEGVDVVDPFGAELDMYRACAHEIRQHLQARLNDLPNRGSDRDRS